MPGSRWHSTSAAAVERATIAGCSVGVTSSVRSPTLDRCSRRLTSKQSTGVVSSSSLAAWSGPRGSVRFAHSCSLSYSVGLGLAASVNSLPSPNGGPSVGANSVCGGVAKGWAKSSARALSTRQFKNNNFPSVKIKTSGYQTQECFIATLAT